MGFESRDFVVNNDLFLGVENSATGRAWRDRLDARGSARALAIAQRHDLPELLARILAGRNVEIDAVEAFLDPTIKRSMPDPNVLSGMVEAVARLADAIARGETIAIFGDYDVDGATSAALLARPQVPARQELSRFHRPHAHPAADREHDDRPQRSRLLD